jgi:hypothetical protein
MSKNVKKLSQNVKYLSKISSHLEKKNNKNNGATVEKVRWCNSKINK